MSGATFLKNNFDWSPDWSPDSSTCCCCRLEDTLELRQWFRQLVVDPTQIRSFGCSSRREELDDFIGACILPEDSLLFARKTVKVFLFLGLQMVEVLQCRSPRRLIVAAKTMISKYWTE